MHRSEIDPQIVDRIAAFRGPDGFVKIVPSRTAHVVVDLQIAFVGEGASSEVPLARSIIGNVNRVSNALRAAGGTVIFLQMTFDPDEPHQWRSMYGRLVPERIERMKASLSLGAVQHALYPEVDVRAGDLILTKTRYSAFIPGTCDLEAVLKARGIETLIVSGTLTNCCCESTVRDAMQVGYDVLFVQDGSASQSDAAHNATLSNLCAFLFAEIVTADQAIARISEAAA